MKALNLLVSLVTVSTIAHADVGAATAAYAQCEGTLHGGTHAELVIRPTAVPTLTQGLLVVGDSEKGAVNTYCQASEQATGGVATAGTELFTCVEARSGDGKITISIARGGVTGIVTARVSREQIFPMPSILLGTLVCK